MNSENGFYDTTSPESCRTDAKLTKTYYSLQFQVLSKRVNEDVTCSVDNVLQHQL